MKRAMRPSRELVLDAIRATPDITTGSIAEEVGLSPGRVVKILATLLDDGSIQWRMVPPQSGISRSPRRGYFIAEQRSAKIPAMWDVLAHLFGRIAEPAVA